MIKINYTKWGINSEGWQFATPYINIIKNKGLWNYTQISFVIGNHHWWITII
jgi:hypothetical protein